MIQPTQSKLRIVIYGAGNMAWHLTREFALSGRCELSVSDRTPGKAKELSKEFNCRYLLHIDNNVDCDLLVLAVNDSAIAEIIQQLTLPDAVIVHTAGSMPMNVLSSTGNKYGVFYPFQTLTRGLSVDFKNVPVCIEASDKQSQDFLLTAAKLVSNSVQLMDSAARKKLHLAGIIANNFVNHLYTLVNDFMQLEGLKAELITPLIQETCRKAGILNPAQAQTGPARRNNKEIITQHIEMLKGQPSLKNLYSLISDSIIAYYSGFTNDKLQTETKPD